MEGLPDGVIFKDPNSYGLSTLRQIISQKESIKFVNVTPASTLASSATSSKELENGNITDVTDAPAIPLELREVPMEEVADAIDITIELENGNITDVTDAPAIPLELREVPMEEVADAIDITIELENGNITDVTDAPAIPLELREVPMEEVADAIDITIGVSDTLAHAVSSDAVEEHGVEVLTGLITVFSALF
ncbi:general transcription factor II-I repeat domain-containing protein 1-like [Mytilus californianus]|uniref:general transcription factor II-I repeat domain-containing protein 1-like n=1 Tax=Mytilus californianus TaxID=6549 RepID=UPI002246DE54|nr:general transcription factor II-I repeat domain-containing protein 1-like [Mytilus californianus]